MYCGSWEKLKQLTAWIHRLVKKPETGRKLPKYLLAEQVKFAGQFWVRHTQMIDQDLKKSVQEAGTTEG
jgi:oligoendopeptidase F